MNIFNIIYNRFLYRPFIKAKARKTGDRFRLGFSSIVNNPHMFAFGDEFFSGPFCYFSTSKVAKVDIGDYVMFGPACKVIGGNHNMAWSGGHMMHSPCNTDDKGIVIEDGVWVGANALILDGSIVSEGAVIGAGAVVIGYVPPYTIAVGVPAKNYRIRFTKNELEVLLKNIKSGYTVESIYQIYAELKLLGGNK